MTRDTTRTTKSAAKTTFRLPRPDDPAPNQRRLMGICGWAAALGIVGMLVGLLALVAMVRTTVGWYSPTVLAVGLAGILSTIGAA